ncbi:MAG: efflux transporter outer membrane subunit [Myxococcaceae bacterium]
MVRRKIVGTLVCAVLVGGCTLAPAYTRPEAPVSQAYPVETKEEGDAHAADLGWRDVFGDERLQSLVSLALENNRDLRVAALNVERVQAQYRIQRAPLFPNVGLGANATFQELPSAIPSSAFIPKSQYSLNLGVTSWELDFFGRTRSLSDAALEQYFATDEARRSAHLALVGQVATAHFNERATSDQLELARKTLQLVEESFRLTQRSFELGTSSELDLKTGESQVETARATLAFYEQQHAQAVNALVFLIGRPLPDDLPASKPLGEATVMADLPAGLPSDLLARRPDILAAEHQLLAANANIGAARAAFFPSISLTGAGGLSSPDLGSLFAGSAFTWNFIPRLNLPIFQGGALKANLDVAEISKRIEIAEYERAIQAAFRDVADALVTRETIGKQLEAQKARVAAEERRYQLAEMRYRAGIERYVTLLTAQRDLYSAQQQLIDVQFARLANVANLYRALGGGWNENTATAEAAPAQPGQQG